MTLRRLQLLAPLLARHAGKGSSQIGEITLLARSRFAERTFGRHSNQGRVNQAAVEMIGSYRLMALRAALCLFAFVLSAGLPRPASSAEFMDTQERHEFMIDLNGDSAMDRGILNQGKDGLGLSISLSKDGASPGPASSPDFVRNAIGAGVVSGLSKGENGELLLAYGCGGCSDDTTSMLSIILKDGDFLVSRYQLDWETREGSGQCIIDYAAGTGELTIDVEEKTTLLKGPFKIKKLSDWDETSQDEACGG
jgi:hypothetical protein